MFLFYFYFRIVSFFYLDLFSYSYLFNFFIVNSIIVLIDVIAFISYRFISDFKNYYILYVFIGLVIGLFLCFLMFSLNKYEFSDYLAIISYFVINNVFIMYSLSFEKEKKKVFE